MHRQLLAYPYYRYPILEIFLIHVKFHLICKKIYMIFHLFLMDTPILYFNTFVLLYEYAIYLQLWIYKNNSKSVCILLYYIKFLVIGGNIYKKS